MSNRVTHVLAPARHGGMERVVELLARGQRARGIDARVVAIVSPGDDDADHPFFETLRKADIPHTTLVTGGRDYRREYHTLKSLFRDLKPDVVHTHGYRPDIVAGMAARSMGLMQASTVHGFTGNGLRNRLNEWLQERALRRADLVIAVSGLMGLRLERAGVRRARVRVIPNGFMTTTALLSRTAARESLELPPTARVAGWLGRLSPEKGPDVAIDALAETDASWQLSMMGDGRARPVLEARANDAGLAGRVRWHGMVRDGGSLLPAFDAFVLSSRTEGTPIALLEAMNAGTPIVATRVGGVPDVVRDGEALLVPTENPGALAAALHDLARDPDAAQQRADAARRRLVSAYGIDQWLDSIGDAYASL